LEIAAYSAGSLEKKGAAIPEKFTKTSSKRRERKTFLGICMDAQN
jgi:hypothetical protein